MKPTTKIFVAGHRGMVGSAIIRHLQQKGFENIIIRSRSELDLCDQQAVQKFFKEVKPEEVYLAAAKVGGVHANSTYPAEFIYENLMIQTNVIHQAFLSGVKKLLFLGSSCIYPREVSQPMSEEALLTGKLEPTNEPYAIAKIAGIKMCESYRRQYGCNFIAAMPTNLYGPNDNYDLNNSHVLPALIRKMHEAKTSGAATVEIWGSGTPLREFLHVDDLASACLFLMQHYNEELFVNVGFGSDLSIRELAEKVKAAIGFEGELVFNTEKPDGTPKKLMDSSRILSMGWKPKIELRQGIMTVYGDVKEMLSVVK